jgi:hypothetical protein
MRLIQLPTFHSSRIAVAVLMVLAISGCSAAVESELDDTQKHLASVLFDPELSTMLVQSAELPSGWIKRENTTPRFWATRPALCVGLLVDPGESFLTTKSTAAFERSDAGPDLFETVGSIGMDPGLPLETMRTLLGVCEKFEVLKSGSKSEILTSFRTAIQPENRSLGDESLTYRLVSDQAYDREFAVVHERTLVRIQSTLVCFGYMQGFSRSDYSTADPNSLVDYGQERILGLALDKVQAVSKKTALVRSSVGMR